MTKIFIHIGTHKTGTTTIQHALQVSSVFYGRREGWDYLPIPLAARNLMNAQIYDEKIVREFSKDLRKLIKKSNNSLTKIISSEALSGTSSNGYLNSSVVAMMLRDITKTYDTKIIVYLRRQDEIVESMYTQEIHEGNSLSFEEYFSKLTPGLSFNYSRFIKDWVSCFGENNIIVRSYHSAAKRGLLKDFGEIIGSTGILNSSSERKNPGYSYNAIKIAQLVNTILDDPLKENLRHALQKTMAKQKSETYAYLSKDNRNKFLNMYKDTNQELADLCFNGTVTKVFPKTIQNISEAEGIGNQECIAYEDLAPFVMELLYSSRPKVAVGLIAGVKVIISGYPRLKKVLQTILGDS